MPDPPVTPSVGPAVPAPPAPAPPTPGPDWLALQVPAAPQVHVGQQMNWSHFRSEFAGKPEGDGKAHLLCTNDQMNKHNFPGDVRVQRFCLTLLREARLWYESLRLIANDLQALKEQFRQQYSKIGNTREQLFYPWRSFHYDENSEMIEVYVKCISQVATLLGYEEQQALKVFKNTIPNRLY